MPLRDAHDADLCGRCGAELEFDLRGNPIRHECCMCRDLKRIRTGDLNPGEYGFGKVEPCPRCGFRTKREGDETAVASANRLGMGIPPMYERASFATFDGSRGDGDALSMAQAYAVNWPPSWHLLTFASNSKGNGKTTLACALLNEIGRRHQVYGHFESWPDLVAEMRDASRAEATVPIAAIVDRIAGADILVLDDVGVGRQTEFVEEQLYREVNRRYAIGKPLIVTTNTWAKLDDRVRSRLNDRERGRLVLFTASDARPQLPLQTA